MRIYSAIKGGSGVSSTSLKAIAQFTGGSPGSIRTLFSRSGKDVIKYRGATILRSELVKIKGRGRRSFA